MESAVSFAPLHPAGFVHITGGRCKACFSRGGAACFSAGRAFLIPLFLTEVTATYSLVRLVLPNMEMLISRPLHVYKRSDCC